ncbi:leucine-rich repeat domain-containing protein [Porphyromonas endodontalis]|uniref:leucine-rich repeat domain-containing protein n=1 Tax=Porphyromonas endodontalis TaxID=28124 RepID=UPI003609C3EF
MNTNRVALSAFLPSTRRSFPLLLLGLLVFFISSCSPSGSGSEPLPLFSLSDTLVQMEVGSEFTLKTSVPIGEIESEVKDPKIVSIDQRLCIKALAEGSTEILLKYKGSRQVVHVSVVAPAFDQERFPMLPWLKMGATEEAVKAWEGKHGGEVFLSGKVPDSEDETYITFRINEKSYPFREYFFERGVLAESRVYSDDYEEYWTLDEGGKPTPNAQDLISQWGFRFYGYNNENVCPTAVGWSAALRLMCYYGPRIKAGKTFMMFDFFESDEPSVVSDEPKEATFLLTPTPGGPSSLSIMIESLDAFTIDWGDGKKKEYPAGNYELEKIIKGTILGPTLRVVAPKATSFGVFGAKLDDIIIGEASKLEELRLIGSNLQQLDLSKCPALRFLSIGNNKLKSLDLSHNPDLEELHCYKNEISHLNLSSCPKLNLLYAQKNQLQEVDLSANLALRNLALSTNPLRSIDVSRHTLLEELTLSNTQLKTLGALPPLSHLLTLQLARVGLTTEELNAIYTALPDVRGIPIADDEKPWKCVLNLREIPNAAKSSLQIARDKGWNIQQ